MVFCILFCLAWLPVRIFYPTKVIGKKNLLKKQGFVFTCNHYSNMDPIILNIFLTKKIRFLAKKELFKNKIMAWLMKKLGAFPVDRQKMEMSTFKFAINTLKSNKILGIFPEGTRNKTESEELQEVKSGAIVFAGKSEVPIIPAVFYKKSKFLRRNYLLIGEPFYVEAENSKKMTQEEIEKNTARLTIAMNNLKVEFEEKKIKRKVKNAQK